MLNKSKFQSRVKEMFTLVMMVTLFFALAACNENPIAKKSTIVEQFGNLSVVGNKIVDKDGKQVALYGMSLFWSQIKGKYYNYDCVKWLRDDWNCTVVRAAMGIEKADDIDGYLVNKEKEYNKVITVIDACIDLGIYVIVDWHDHHAEKNKDEAIEFFSKIATKYGNTPNIIYEIYNEPLQISWADIVKPYSVELIDTIRKIDHDNIIVVTPPSWAQEVDVVSLDPIDGENIAYSLHYYASSHKQYLRDKAQVAIDNGLPLFVTEFGTTEYTGDGEIDTVEVKAWFDFLEANKISWCNWSIGDKAETSAALMPGADAKGGWADSSISYSGKMLKNKIKSYNAKLFK
jgi:endoglucanase